MYMDLTLEQQIFPHLHIDGAFVDPLNRINLSEERYDDVIY